MTTTETMRCEICCEQVSVNEMMVVTEQEIQACTSCADSMYEEYLKKINTPSEEGKGSCICCDDEITYETSIITSDGWYVCSDECLKAWNPTI